jgi:hypothetical protein
MRGSNRSNATRTFTVAFCRSAVGMTVRTVAAICQSPYASSTAIADCPGLTRAIYDSLTSTSISSESISTMVAMPVRVKPPPAETGDTISPT